MSIRLWLLLAFATAVSGCLPLRGPWAVTVPEQRLLDIRPPEALPHVALPVIPEPETVSHRFPDDTPKELSLNEAIRIALANSQVIRVLAGTTAVSSGRTIYDPAISNALIDEARAVFDPNVGIRSDANRIETPGALLNPTSITIEGTRIDNYELGLGISKKMITGGTIGLDILESTNRYTPEISLLDPLHRSTATLRFNQPLLQGAGVEVNIAPIVIARINTERSFFANKGAVQDMVRGVIEAYWNVVFARTDLWVRKQQVEQGEAALARAEARKRQGFGNAAEVAQAKSAYLNFKAASIGAEANLLQREAALRNIMGLPPSDPPRFIPTTPLTTVKLEPKWDEIVRLAEERRPDIIELKLVLEADQQQLILAQNQSLPQLNAQALYRWNGLDGETPSGSKVSSAGGQFTDWTLGVNFSVPLGLRAGRAELRRSELILARDRANIQQVIHATVHDLADAIRGLAQYHEQYLAYLDARKAARTNLEQQLADFRAGRTIFLNVLQGITDWGNSVSNEAGALARYNIGLALLEQRTGTILDTHAVTFSEERFRSIGPLGRCFDPVCYPEAAVPGPNKDRYESSKDAAESSLEKELPSIKAPKSSGSNPEGETKESSGGPEKAKPALDRERDKLKELLNKPGTEKRPVAPIKSIDALPSLPDLDPAKP